MGARGPKPLPSNVHALHGNPSKIPLGRLLDGVHPEVEIPDCPAHLQPEAKKEWKRISRHLEELGLISQIDRAALAGYCSAWAETVFAEKKIAEKNKASASGEAGYVTQTPSGYEQMSVWVQIRNRAYERMMKFAAEFGMSPSARSRVTPSDNSGQLGLPGVEDKPSMPTTGWGSV